jgi:hypothetical protein
LADAAGATTSTGKFHYFGQRNCGRCGCEMCAWLFNVPLTLSPLTVTPSPLAQGGAALERSLDSLASCPSPQLLHRTRRWSKPTGACSERLQT